MAPVSPMIKLFERRMVDLQEGSSGSNEKTEYRCHRQSGRRVRLSGFPSLHGWASKKTGYSLWFTNQANLATAFVRSRKGSMFLTINFHGGPAHAGNNPQDGRNAIEAMAKAIPEIKAIASEYKDVTLNADVVKGRNDTEHYCRRCNRCIWFPFFNDQTRGRGLRQNRSPLQARICSDVTSELKYVAKSSALSHTEKSQKLIELVDQASKDLGQPAPKWMDVGGASDGNRFSGGGAAVACAMGVIGGDSPILKRNGQIYLLSNLELNSAVKSWNLSLRIRLIKQRQMCVLRGTHEQHKTGPVDLKNFGFRSIHRL